MAAARVTSPDGQISMVMQTGDAFLEVVKPAGLDEKHEDDRIDPYFGIRMRRYLLADEYLEKIALIKAGEETLQFVTDGSFPSRDGQEADRFEAAVKGEADAYLAEISRDDQWRCELRHVIAAHPMKMYRVGETKETAPGSSGAEAFISSHADSDHILIVGTDFYAYDYDLIGSGSGALSGLPGGLMGKGTGSYIRWGSRLIGTLNAFIGAGGSDDGAADSGKAAGLTNTADSGKAAELTDAADSGKAAALTDAELTAKRRAAMRDFFRFAASFRWADEI